MIKPFTVLLLLITFSASSAAEVIYRILSPTSLGNSISLTNNGRFSNLCRVEWLNANRRASDVTISQGGATTIAVRPNSTELIDTNQVIDRNITVNCTVNQDEVRQENERQIIEAQRRQRETESRAERTRIDETGRSQVRRSGVSNQVQSEAELSAARRAKEDQSKNLQLMDEKIAILRRENEVSQELMRINEMQKKVERENAERAERLAQTTSMLNNLGDTDLQRARGAIDFTKLPIKCRNYSGSYNVEVPSQKIDQNTDAERLFSAAIKSDTSYDAECALHKAIEAHANKQLATEEFTSVLRKILIPLPLPR